VVWFNEGLDDDVIDKVLKQADALYFHKAAGRPSEPLLLCLVHIASHVRINAFIVSGAVQCVAAG